MTFGKRVYKKYSGCGSNNFFFAFGLFILVLRHSPLYTNSLLPVHMRFVYTFRIIGHTSYGRKISFENKPFGVQDPSNISTQKVVWTNINPGLYFCSLPYSEIPQNRKTKWKQNVNKNPFNLKFASR